ncbi:MAG: roadblock/LC7 domain-containing protein [Promethearchaeota archaeon]|nr:MAG: roadblock/LC7 domain-containing protein [Candidatus Lokiarchaeota archaeon]
MNLKEKIKIHLDQIKQLKGVENAVLTQRDGNPIQSAGVWFSKEEIFNVSSAASAIFNVGINLHPDDLKYILIEGKKAKILIAPLNNPIHSSLNKILEKQGIIEDNHEFFIAITAQPNVNLGGIFLQTNECLKNIKTTLITSGESFKPPLIEFNSTKIRDILESFSIKKNNKESVKLSSFSLDISEELSWELNKILNNFSLTILDLKYALLSLEGGFIINKILRKTYFDENEIDNISAMSYSLFQTANRCAWALKKMTAENILLDCTNSFHFIYEINNAVFSSEVGKSRQKLGLIRLYLPQFLNKLDKLIQNAKRNQKERVFDIKNLIGELVIK